MLHAFGQSFPPSFLTEMWQTEQFKNVHLTAVSFSGPLAYSVKRPNNVDAMAQPLADIFCGTDHVIARTTEATGGEVLLLPPTPPLTRKRAARSSL